MTYQYNIFIPFLYHHKNDEFIHWYSQFFKKKTNNIIEADIIFSSSKPFEINNYPEKKFIFGPHFSILPNIDSLQLNNIHNNSIYIMPSKQAMNVWKNHFKFNNIPITYCPFGVNTDKFSPTQNTKENKKIFIYFKKRNPDELKFVKEFLSKRNIKYIEFKYGKYDEKYYINQLKKTKYGIWIGQHESQGFALLEALSMNVPLLVWSTKFLWQEYKSTKYNNIHIRQITNPYWDNTCGEFFFEKEDFEKTFNIFINKLNYYQPRKFILENLSFQICKQKFDKLLNNYFNLNLS